MAINFLFLSEPGTVLRSHGSTFTQQKEKENGMKEGQKEPKLTWALNTLGKMVYIDSVDRGLSCNCRCPKCNEPLVAKLGHEGGRQAHFAHCKGYDCHGSYMTALHKLAEQIIEEEKAVMAPAYKEIGRQRMSFTQVEVEQRVERKDLQPDIVGVTEDGLRWIIEIRNTHEVDESKKAKLIESNITCLEIDVREQTLENLKSFILESAENREWINNPIYDAQIVEAKCKRVSKLEEYLLSCTELTFPAYEDYDSGKISIKEAFVLSKTDDKLFSQVKVLSSEGVPFVFNIGSHDILETDINKESLGECNELIIVTDNLSPEDDINSSALDMSWSYHLVAEKEREEKAKEYRNNPKYDVIPSSDCPYKCKYRPVNGECIYIKEVLHIKGDSYVVCDKERRLKDEKYSFVSDESPYDKKIIFRNAKFELALRERLQTTKQIIEKPQRNIQGTTMSENLPFEKFWTIEDYYKYLNSLGSYETEKGYYAEIVQCEKVCNKIILLYIYPVDGITPYHIAVISTDNGNLIRNDVAVYTNSNSAMKAYCKRLSAMRNSMCCQPDMEIHDNDLPF